MAAGIAGGMRRCSISHAAVGGVSLIVDRLPMEAMAASQAGTPIRKRVVATERARSESTGRRESLAARITPREIERALASGNVAAG